MRIKENECGDCRMEIERAATAEGDAANVRVKWTEAGAFEWHRLAFVTIFDPNPLKEEVMESY